MCINAHHLEGEEDQEKEPEAFSGFGIEISKSVTVFCAKSEECRDNYSALIRELAQKKSMESFLAFMEDSSITEQISLSAKLLGALKLNCMDCHFSLVPTRVATAIYDEAAAMVRRKLKRFEDFGAPIFTLINTVLRAKITPQQKKGVCFFEGFCEEMALKRRNKTLSVEDITVWGALSDSCPKSCIMRCKDLVLEKKDEIVIDRHMAAYASTGD